MVDIVLVDDDEMTRTALRLLLREADYDVAGEAKDGVAGLAMVERLQPALVCLDIQILMVTASADRQSVGRALALGAAGFIVKPFNSDRVVKSVRAALRGRQPKSTMM